MDESEEERSSSQRDEALSPETSDSENKGNIVKLSKKMSRQETVKVRIVMTRRAILQTRPMTVYLVGGKTTEVYVNSERSTTVYDSQVNMQISRTSRFYRLPYFVCISFPASRLCDFHPFRGMGM